MTAVSQGEQQQDWDNGEGKIGFGLIFAGLERCSEWKQCRGGDRFRPSRLCGTEMLSAALRHMNTSDR